MEEKEFNIRRDNSTIILTKDNESLTISQSLGDDLWFSTSEDDMTMELSINSRGEQEFRAFLVFESFIKLLIGRYILSGDYNCEYSLLPEDFINLESKTITWHCDGGLHNTLKLIYDNGTIKISISKDKDGLDHPRNAVRIRTDGSEYMYYYKEFLELYRQLINLEFKLNGDIKKVMKSPDEQQKVLSLFEDKNKIWEY